MAMPNFKHAISLPINSLGHFLGDYTSDKNESISSANSATQDLQQVIKDKAILEEESRRLDDEQERLHLRAKMLCGKIILLQMRKRNTEKRQALDQLQAKISKLEAQLRPLSSDPV